MHAISLGQRSTEGEPHGHQEEPWQEQEIEAGTIRHRREARASGQDSRPRRSALASRISGLTDMANESKTPAKRRFTRGAAKELADHIREVREASRKLRDEARAAVRRSRKLVREVAHLHEEATPLMARREDTRK